MIRATNDEVEQWRSSGATPGAVVRTSYFLGDIPSFSGAAWHAQPKWQAKVSPERSRLWEWFAKPLAGMRACLGAQQSSGTR